MALRVTLKQGMHDVIPPNVTGSPVALTSSWESLEESRVRLLAYAVTYTGLMMVLGSVGNGVVCYVYGVRWQSTVTKTFILSLAVLDLLNCLICMPTEIVMLVKNMSFDVAVWCKVTRFLTYMLNGSCSLILVAIALDRWYKVCRPLQYFFTARRAKLTCAGSVLLAALLSSPSLLLYGSLTVRVAGSDVTGVTCLVSDQFIDTWWPLVFYALYFSCYLMLVLVITVLYTLIAVRLVQLKKQQSQRKTSKHSGLRSSKLLFPSQEMIPLTTKSGQVDPNHNNPLGSDRQRKNGVRVHMICEEAESLSVDDVAEARVEIVRPLSFERLAVIEEDDSQKYDSLPRHMSGPRLTQGLVSPLAATQTELAGIKPGLCLPAPADPPSSSAPGKARERERSSEDGPQGSKAEQDSARQPSAPEQIKVGTSANARSSSTSSPAPSSSALGDTSAGRQDKMEGLGSPARRPTWNLRARLSKKKEAFKSKSLRMPDRREDFRQTEGQEVNGISPQGASVFSLDEVIMERPSQERPSPPLTSKDAPPSHRNTFAKKFHQQTNLQHPVITTSANNYQNSPQQSEIPAIQISSDCCTQLTGISGEVDLLNNSHNGKNSACVEFLGEKTRDQLAGDQRTGLFGLRFSERKAKKKASSKWDGKGWSSYRDKSGDAFHTGITGPAGEEESDTSILKWRYVTGAEIVGYVYQEKRSTKPSSGDHASPKASIKATSIRTARSASPSPKMNRYPSLDQGNSSVLEGLDIPCSPSESIRASRPRADDGDTDELEQGIHFASQSEISWRHNPIVFTVSLKRHGHGQGEITCINDVTSYASDTAPGTTTDHHHLKNDPSAGNVSGCDVIDSDLCQDLERKISIGKPGVAEAASSGKEHIASSRGGNKRVKLKKAFSEIFTLSPFQRQRLLKKKEERTAADDSNVDDDEEKAEEKEKDRKEKARLGKTTSEPVTSSTPTLLAPPPSTRSSFLLPSPGRRTPSSCLPTPAGSTPDRLRSDASVSQMLGALILERLSKKMAYRPARTTRMLFAISLVFVLSFLPFFIVVIMRALRGTAFYLTLTDLELVLVNIFVRSSFLSNATNPIIYGLCNKQFRTECCQLIGRCFRRKRDVVIRVFEQTDDALA